jgi:site-specific DNA-methyltransferase (adenine-specific)
MPPRVTGSQLLREVQEITGITKDALARKLGVTRAEIGAWLEGAKVPRPQREALREFLAYARAPRAAGHPRVESPHVTEGVVQAESLAHLRTLPDASVDMILSDIPYGIGLDDWDVLHANTNSAYLGRSQAQKDAGKVFEKRRKPINGWSAADREIPREYERWCASWAPEWLRVLKPGGSAMVFAGRRLAHRCAAALEDAGFNYRDTLAWIRPQAVLRAQRLSTVFRKRGELGEAEHWQGWRVGNLRPRFEPIAWLFKPYKLTIADNVLDHGLGAFDLDAWQARVGSKDNVLELGFRPGEAGEHEAQKPVDLLRALIELCCPAGRLVVDPFAGSGSTGVAAIEAGRRCLLVERDAEHVRTAKRRLAQARAGA